MLCPCCRKQTHDDLGHEHSVELENNLFDCNNLFSEFHDMNVREDFVRGLLALAERVTETQARLLRNSLPSKKVYLTHFLCRMAAASL